MPGTVMFTVPPVSVALALAQVYVTAPVALLLAVKLMLEKAQVMLCEPVLLVMVMGYCARARLLAPKASKNNKALFIAGLFNGCKDTISTSYCHR